MNRSNKRDAASDEPLEVSVVVLAETDLAILVTEEIGNEKHWLPKSQIDSQDWEIGKVHTITLPRWLVEAKGLTDD